LARHWRRETPSDTPVESGADAGLGMVVQYPFPFGEQAHSDLASTEVQSVLLVQEVRAQFLPVTQSPEDRLAARPLSHKKVSIVKTAVGLVMGSLEQFELAPTVPTAVHLPLVHH